MMDIFRRILHAMDTGSVPARKSSDAKSAASQESNEGGFTIIELLIATTVFSLVLLMAVAGILRITSMYYQGVAQARTQDTARTVIDEIGESIRFTDTSLVIGAPTTSGPDIAVGMQDTDHFCLGDTRYTYAIDRQLKADAPALPATEIKRHVLWVDQVTDCLVPALLNEVDPSAGAGAGANGRELLSENMRLMRFEVMPLGLVGSYRITIGIGYGDDDLLQWDGTSPVKSCEGVFAGREFCAASNLSLVVTERL